jgi:hypothetical protein
VEPFPPSRSSAGVANRLAADLVIVDREYREAGSALDWQEYYVEWFLQKYGRAAARAAAR